MLTLYSKIGINVYYLLLLRRGVRESSDGVTGGGTVRISLHRPPQRAVRHAANGLLLNTDSTLLLHKAPQYIVRYQKLPENTCSKLKQVSFSGDFSQKNLFETEKWLWFFFHC